MTRTFTLLALLASGATLLGGCSNVGDTNPISPDKMNQMRRQESAQRSGFKPSGTPPPANTGK